MIKNFKLVGRVKTTKQRRKQGDKEEAIIIILELLVTYNSINIYIVEIFNNRRPTIFTKITISEILSLNWRIHKQ